MAQYDVCAREAFTKALEGELQKRDMKIYISGNYSKSLVKCPKEVTVTSAKYGKRKYRMSPYKHEHNIEPSSSARFFHSMILDKHPLCADTLHCVWDSLLHEKHVMAKTLVRVGVTDLSEEESKAYSGNTAQFAPIG